MFTAITTHSLAFASITQLAEYFYGKEEAVSSSLTGSSKPILYYLTVREQSSGSTGGRVMVATRLVTETTK